MNNGKRTQPVRITTSADRAPLPWEYGRSHARQYCRGRTVLGIVAATTMAALSLVGVSTTAQAAPSTSLASTVLFAEDFENGAGLAPEGLAEYSGFGGQTYTANDAWLENCNGSIVNFDIPYGVQGNCENAQSSANLRQLAYALGVHSGAAEPNINNAVAAYTEVDPGDSLVEFATVGNIPLTNSSGRFLTFSVDTAAVHCEVSTPLYQFGFRNDLDSTRNVGGIVNACTSTATVMVPEVGPSPANSVRVGTYTSDGSILFDGSSLGITMKNANGSGSGNAAAFDNVRVLDVTPQLDKSFSPASVVVGEKSSLTLTITNTDELASKNGWSFTDTLPAGLSIADGAAATTCPSGVITAPSGATVISMSGDLTSGMESCAVTVNVTSAEVGMFTNGPDNVASVGLDLPMASTVEFVEMNPAASTGTPPEDFDGPAPVSQPSHITIPGQTGTKSISMEKTVSPSSVGTVGQTVNYYFTVTNTGNVALSDVSVVEGEFSGTGELSEVVCPAGADVLAPGNQVTCSATYSVTQEDMDAGSVKSAATATGSPPNDGCLAATGLSVAEVKMLATPAIAVVKSADAASQKNLVAGQIVSYGFLITNIGNVTLRDVAVEEREFSGVGALSEVICPANSSSSLAPDAQVNCNATYTVQQADVEAGSLTNAATAVGNPPNEGTPTRSPESVVTIPSLAAPALGLIKTANVDRATTVGQVITYSFAVTNTGNVTMMDVTVNEGMFSGTGSLSAVLCPAGASALAPSAQIVCSATYAVTQADLSAGSISNTAQVTGKTRCGEIITSAPSMVRVTTHVPVLAWTGADPQPLALAALFLLLFGGTALLTARIRRTL